MGFEAKRVEEITIPLAEYPHVRETATLKDAMAVFKCQLVVEGERSLPRVVLVLNAAREIVGQVRRRDILRGLEPEFLVARPGSDRQARVDFNMDANLLELFFDRAVEGIRERSMRRVSEIMLPVEVTINHDDHIIKAIYELVDKNLSLLPVLKDREVIGVVRSVDVFRELSRIVLPEHDNSGDCD
ncbi:MAG: CBS domain-containing protein [Candidatus Zixiibacteriota bacterium]